VRASARNLPHGHHISPYFITHAEKMVCELENPYILIHEKKLSEPAVLASLLPLLEAVVQSPRGLKK
jgi:chaperonin GroEL